MEIEIEINGEPRVFEVEAKYEGRFRAGDYENPPEYPELHIYSIKDEEGNEVELHSIDEARIANKVALILDNE